MNDQAGGVVRVRPYAPVKVREHAFCRGCRWSISREYGGRGVVYKAARSHVAETGHLVDFGELRAQVVRIDP